VGTPVQGILITDGLSQYHLVEKELGGLQNADDLMFALVYGVELWEAVHCLFRTAVLRQIFLPGKSRY
jgi:hypothetical protein